MKRGAALLLLAACAPAAPAREPEAKPDPLHAPWPNRSPIGANARPLRVRNLGGSDVLDIAPGKVNVIAFWATWSSPDLYMLSAIEPTWKKLEARGLVITAISLDEDKQGVLDAARAQGATYTIAWDEGHETASRYFPSTDPCMYIIDRGGVIRFVHHGFHDGEAAVVEREIESLL